MNQQRLVRRFRLRVHLFVPTLIGLVGCAGVPATPALPVNPPASVASPATSVRERQMILHGDADGMVPYQLSELLAKGLQAAGVEVTYILVPGGEHGYGASKEKVNSSLLDPTLQFLNKHLLAK